MDSQGECITTRQEDIKEWWEEEVSDHTGISGRLFLRGG